jgi:hypothetical protein
VAVVLVAFTAFIAVGFLAVALSVAYITAALLVAVAFTAFIAIATLVAVSLAVLIAVASLVVVAAIVAIALVGSVVFTAVTPIIVVAFLTAAVLVLVNTLVAFVPIELADAFAIVAAKLLVGAPPPSPTAALRPGVIDSVVSVVFDSALVAAAVLAVNAQLSPAAAAADVAVLSLPTLLAVAVAVAD